MKLIDVFEHVNYKVIQGTLSSNLIEICNDSRLAQEGSLFIAIRGYQLDAHDFLETVLIQGCRILVIEDLSKVDPKWEKSFPDATIIWVESTLKAMAQIASQFYGSPSKKFTVIGVTGTNGKTSIAQLTGNCLEALNQDTAVLGTTGNRIGDQFYPTSNTTVESIKLQWLFQEMSIYPIDTCVMEVSSHALRTHRVDETSFDYSIFTNLTEDHLDFHADMEDYYQAKRELFLKTEKCAIINQDDVYGAKLISELKSLGKAVVSYGLTSEADYQAIDIISHHDGSEFTLKYPKGEIYVKIPIPGKIYVYNVLAVLSVLDLMGCDAAELSTAIKAIRPVEGRLEVIPNKIGATVVVDYAHTPDALDKVLEVCREFTMGRLYVVFGCGGDRDKMKRPLMGQIAVKKADSVILTSDNPRTEDPQLILEDILAGISELEKTNVAVEVDRRTAIIQGIKQIKKGDTLLIAGKGHETYQVIGKVKTHFDDREEAALALEKL
jgi:UDP-N-acetylmuramoyl-L-alanyl-D-glutamate--2,6-diaminopimelate ligase